MNVATILHTHTNSKVFKDTLESVKYYLTNNILVAIDGFACKEFENENYFKLCGFNHGSPSSPYRNVCLSLMQAWNVWRENVDWYCYMEYDCLVGSNEILTHLKIAKDAGIWVLGNDYRTDERNIEIIDLITKNKTKLHYLLGCCVFYNSQFIKKLSEDNFFEKFLHLTNEYPKDFKFSLFRGRQDLVYDISEFLYPTLAVNYGGKVQELASWNAEKGWIGNYDYYPMRFKPDLTECDPFKNACILHPLKNYENSVREFHRKNRNILTQEKIWLY